MREKRVPIYDRLPQIYYVRDAEQSPPDQLKHYLAAVEAVFGEIHANIESLYHDLFIDTCDEWVIPYLADLLGTSHLKGNAHTLRADVADTIALRRRKGTLGAIELLTYNLTRWGVHAVELRENLLWNQHLNHPRPDAGGDPPYAKADRFTPVRGGTVPVRDPAMLSLLNTPFDPFGHVVDVKPPVLDAVHYNLPNLAIFLWRLAAYRNEVSPPLIRAVIDNSPPTSDEARFVVRLDVHPLGEPVQLFNTSRFDPDLSPPVISSMDEVSGPIPMARLTENSAAGVPEKYVSIDTYDPTSLTNPDLETVNRIEMGEPGLQLYLPEPTFTGRIWPAAPPDWTLRGENLCAWEAGLPNPLKNNEIAIDPRIGRIVIGVATFEEAQALETGLLLTYTHGAMGPVGAHPILRDDAPETWQDNPVELRLVNFHVNPNGLQAALNDLENAITPVVIEIRDSMVHELDLSAITNPLDEAGGFNLRLKRSLMIRAASGQRPIIRLVQPLRFRPTQVNLPEPDEGEPDDSETGDSEANGSKAITQQDLDDLMDILTVRLEGITLTRGATFPAGAPLIARTALHSLELKGCTLDPSGFQQLDGDRAPTHPSLHLENFYGFEPESAAEVAFAQTPEIHLYRTVSGPLLIDTGYTLFLTDSILDAGEAAAKQFAVAGPPQPVDEDGERSGRLVQHPWGPPTIVSGITVLGRMRVETLRGQGGIWDHTLEVLNNQTGCLKFSYFSGQDDRLPQNHGCVSGSEARLRFNSEYFGQPAYAQLARTSDFRIRERGPKDDAMGAFGFLLEAHKWRNLQIRYREFMPVGVRPLLIPVT